MKPFLGKIRAQCLRTIRKEYAIAEKTCDQITSATISDFAREVLNRAEINSPATVGNYLSHLSAIFTHAAALWGFPLDPAEMANAMTLCKHVGLMALLR